MTIPKALKFFCFLSSPLSYEILQGARTELYSTVQTMSSTTDRYNWIDPTLRRMEQMCQMKQLSSMRNVAPLASAPLTRICSRRLGLAHTVLRCLGHLLRDDTSLHFLQTQSNLLLILIRNSRRRSTQSTKARE